MCGIAGFFNVDADEKVLKAMNKCQAHRGPDGSGVFVDGAVGLAHNRLSIIDIKGGVQPMQSSDGRYTIVYNGEVYNYLELKAELEKLGHSFKTNSDTEVVLTAFAEWGEKSFDKFNGMWGLVIYDKVAKRLTLSRDHFGIKPVYFARVGKGLVFASEITPILASGLVVKKPNDKVIYRYLKFRVHEDSSETFFDGISKLLPGEMLTVDAHSFEIKSYTNLRQDLLNLAKKQLPYNKKARAKYYEELEKSVRLRLQSDVPVGTSLSGGLDSSSVAILISKLMASDKESTQSVGAKQNVFSAVFPGSINDEGKYVDAATEACGKKLNVHKIKPTADEFKQDILEFVRAQEEPLISTGPYAQYKVMQEATKHVKVLLDGQGADETMAGYIPYHFVYLRALKAEKRYFKLLCEAVASFDVVLRLGRFKLADKLKFRKTVTVGSFLNSKFKKAYKNEKFTVVRDNLKERLVEDLFENSIPSLLRYEDKNTMHFSIEGRVPFLDKDLISYVFSLSDDAIIKHGWNKRILRDSLQKALPKMIAKRRNKIGFTTPEHEWFMRLKNYFYDVFLSGKFASRPYFDQEAVLNAFEGFIKGKNSVDSMTFWRLVNVELWLREFFDEPEPAPKVKASDFVANDGKQLDIKASGKFYRRYPIRTEKVNAKTQLDSFITSYVKNFFKELKKQSAEHQKITSGKFYLFVSEKIVAITQGRSYFIWDIKTSFPARFLSKFVTRTPAGIGLGSPFTMQLAIQEVGLARVVFASIGGMVGKLVGKRGLFYILVGSNVRAIDGPTEYSVYPANVSAKLAPKDPEKVAAHLTKKIKDVLPAKYRDNFGGVVVIDSNDIGRNVLGTDGTDDPKLYEEIFADNPLGQAHEQTPICLVFQKHS